MKSQIVVTQQNLKVLEVSMDALVRAYGSFRPEMAESYAKAAVEASGYTVPVTARTQVVRENGAEAVRISWDEAGCLKVGPEWSALRTLLAKHHADDVAVTVLAWAISDSATPHHASLALHRLAQGEVPFWEVLGLESGGAFYGRQLLALLPKWSKRLDEFLATRQDTYALNGVGDILEVMETMAERRASELSEEIDGVPRPVAA